MRNENYKCDKCYLPIDGITTPETGDISMVGGATLCTLRYEGIMGHNKFPNDGLHFHYYCFCDVVSNLTTLLNDSEAVSIKENQ